MTLGQMLLISGPSGSGKSTICDRLRQDSRVVFSISATTREPRRGEEDGREYHFMSPQQFREHMEDGDFIEHAEVYGNMYGTLREPMRKAIAEGKLYLVEIDVQGALQLKALEEPGLYVFIAPPDPETLRKRLEGRGTESPEDLERRLRKAEDESRESDKYDYVVVNKDLDAAVAKVRDIAGLQNSKLEDGA